MIVVLCNSFEEVKDAFDIFLDFLEWDCCEIQKIYHACYCVETDDDLRYIFIDHRMKNLFKNMAPDFLDVEEFFEGIPGFYEAIGCRGYDGY